MSDFRKQLELCETVFNMTIVAADLINKEKIEVESACELFETIYELSQKFEDSDPAYHTEGVAAYATKWLMLEYGDPSKLHGRIWWDIEQQDFIDEAQLYDEYLVMRHDDLTFEEYILGCRTEENGTLELVREK